MPKINNIHKLERLQERLAQIERDEDVDIRDINNLLEAAEQQRLKDLWTDEQAKRKNKSYKQEDWQTKRDFRITVLTDNINRIKNNLVEEFEQMVHKTQVRADRIFLDAYFAAKDNNENAMSKANIAMQRAGFQPVGRTVRRASARDIEVEQMERDLRSRIEAAMTEDEREQLELLRETEAAEKKSKKR